MANGVIAAGQTSVTIPVIHGQYERVWVIEQIGVSYSVATDAPICSVIYDNELYSGPGQMVPQQTGLGISFGGHPYLYIESSDSVAVQVQNGSAGALVKVQVQYRDISYSDSELQGRF